MFSSALYIVMEDFPVICLNKNDQKCLFLHPLDNILLLPWLSLSSVFSLSLFYHKNNYLQEIYILHKQYIGYEKRQGRFFFTCDQISQTTAGPGKPVSLNLNNNNNNRAIMPATVENDFLT